MKTLNYLLGICFFFAALSANAAATHTVTWGTAPALVSMTCDDNGPLFLECVRTGYLLNPRVGEVVTADAWTDVFIQDTPATAVCVRYTPTSHQCWTIGTAGSSALTFTSAGNLIDTDRDLWMDGYDTNDDNDGRLDVSDNCPLIVNNDQLNTDGDLQGDACDTDDDNDGVLDGYDLYPTNNTQAGDYDGDGIEGLVDNCVSVSNMNQLNTDGDTQGNACDTDDDNDGMPDASDQFPLNIAAASDTDNDGFPGSWNAACDASCQSNSGLTLDNCPSVANADQVNTDGDAQGDACDANDDNDSVPDTGDAYPTDPLQAGDIDNDAVDGFVDNCPSVANADQVNTDGDAQGNVCDSDDDNDVLLDASDNCPLISNTDQMNSDGDIYGDVCDVEPFLALAGALDVSFNAGSGANGLVRTSAIQSDGRIFIGGFFTSVDGAVRNRLARLNFDGSLDSSFNPGGGANNDVYTSAIQSDGRIFIGGSFTSVNGTARYRVARLNSDGSLDSSFNPGSGASNYVYTSAIQSDGKIVIGGSFTSVNGVARNRIARLNADGSLDQSFDPGSGTSGTVFTSVVQADGKVIVGGYFTTASGVIRSCIVRLNADGSLDQSFDPGSGMNNTVLTSAVQADGKIIVGGSFTTVNGVVRNRIARLNADGSLDQSFDPGSGMNNAVYTSVVQADGKVIVGGDFTTASGVMRNRVARLNSDGSLDSSFNPGSGANNYVYTSAIQSDGKIVIGGSFTSVNGIARNYVARLHSSDSIAVMVKNDYNHDGIAGWIWKGVSNGSETQSQNWQLTFPLYSVNWAVPNRFYHPNFPDQANWEIVTSGDFNNDGDADIVWRHNSGDVWKIWQMQDGLRVAQTNWTDTFDPAHAWTVIGTGDTDKDGDDDVILNNASTGEVLIWEMQNHTVAATHNVGMKAGYTLNRIGDFNKDGDIDLLFRQNAADELITWELQANTFVAERVLANTGIDYNPVCAGDFDKDGDDDIMLVNSSINQEKWFVMENYARTQQFGGINTGFVFLGCGDYDGDGDADSLWQRSSDAMNRIVLQQNWGASKQTVYTNAFGGTNGFVYRGNSN